MHIDLTEQKGKKRVMKKVNLKGCFYLTVKIKLGSAKTHFRDSLPYKFGGFFSWPSSNSHVQKEKIYCPDLIQASQPRTSELPVPLSYHVFFWAGRASVCPRSAARSLRSGTSTAQTAAWPQVPEAFSYPWRSISNSHSQVVEKFNKVLYYSILC